MTLEQALVHLEDCEEKTFNSWVWQILNILPESNVISLQKKIKELASDGFNPAYKLKFIDIAREEFISWGKYTLDSNIVFITESPTKISVRFWWFKVKKYFRGE